MRSKTSFAVNRFLTAVVAAGALVIQATTYGGALTKQGFSGSELAAFQQLENASQNTTRDVKGGRADWLFSPMTLLAVAVVVGIGLWAANGFETNENECIINGVKIDSNSTECQQAAHLATFGDE
jgi:hypothetical protein